MKNISELTVILKASLGWSKPRTELLSHLLCALFAVRTVNLKTIANAIRSSATEDSRYRQLQRFFAQFEPSYQQLGRFLLRLFFSQDDLLYLTIDRTNWQFGKCNINILMLGIAYKKIAIPIYWVLLDKKGNSNTQERIDLLKKSLVIFRGYKITGLLGDREFVGKSWFRYLQKNKIPFYIRIKKNLNVTDSQGKVTKVESLFSGLKSNEACYIDEAIQLTGVFVCLSALRLSAGELLIIASSEAGKNSIDIYARRWEIETLFQCLKSRGFNLEDTHITEQSRVRKMVGVLAIAFCWSIKTGEWRCEQGETIRIKKHGRPQKSLFRHGLDLLQQIGLQTCHCLKRIRHCLKLLINQPYAPD
ncbi:IS4 family transposase [Zooshikella ganghwensis]|uniref:IS4 family transposase n=1 Tax=Zooshikella ganghwensis TaxID=202772 RepID=A0A4P9VQ94_9GAMM|nr:IS4 family transposase [Zooshikella ganghwensis]RDH42999.1 IS4 family transposase [Zooshikella ganghwensis]RDH45176.1 IS4 family transposase [Zooshikella ganghwensis]